MRLLALAMCPVLSVALFACAAPPAQQTDACAKLGCDEDEREGVERESSSASRERSPSSPSRTGDEAGRDDGNSRSATPTTPPAPAPAPTTPTDPVTICNDLTNAVGDAGARCGENSFETEEAFLDAAAGGSCSNIRSVRDVASLYATCIPWFGTATCADLTNSAAIPAACKAQLQR